ncbi:MAG TPA: IreB family regulatory phosphoprotein [Acetivibrio sp.]|nr:IreB family regulatory phosphoprotein [Acetivibrio sp.]
MADNETMMFKVEKEKVNEARELLLSVYQALKEKGYNPINQIVGYILSGDPTYITNHMDARSAIRKLERDELLEEILRFYLEETANKGSV